MWITAYFHQGMGLAGPNATKLSEIYQFTSQLALPFMISADWNMRPSVQHKSGWLQLVGAEHVDWRRGGLQCRQGLLH